MARAIRGQMLTEARPTKAVEQHEARASILWVNEKELRRDEIVVLAEKNAWMPSVSVSHQGFHRAATLHQHRFNQW